MYGGTFLTGKLLHWDICRTWPLVVLEQLSYLGRCCTRTIVVPGELLYLGNCQNRAVVTPGQLSYLGSCHLGSCHLGYILVLIKVSGHSFHLLIPSPAS